MWRLHHLCLADGIQVEGIQCQAFLAEQPLVRKNTTPVMQTRLYQRGWCSRYGVWRGLRTAANVLMDGREGARLVCLAGTHVFMRQLFDHAIVG